MTLYVNISCTHNFRFFRFRCRRSKSNSKSNSSSKSISLAAFFKNRNSVCSLSDYTSTTATCRRSPQRVGDDRRPSPARGLRSSPITVAGCRWGTVAEYRSSVSTLNKPFSRKLQEIRCFVSALLRNKPFCFGTPRNKPF